MNAKETPYLRLVRSKFEEFNLEFTGEEILETAKAALLEISRDFKLDYGKATTDD